MKKDFELWQFIAEHLQRKKCVILLVVAESSGSSPGRQGFKMAVAEDELRGSIGGGVMETRLVEKAKLKIKRSKSKNKSEIQNPKSEIIKQVHRKNAENSSGMICSGKQTVICKELSADDLEIVNEIISALKNQHEKTLRITNYRLQITDFQPRITNYELRITNHEFLYEEKLGFKNKLFIVGGGHCALALSELMAKMDFYISLFDDRPDLNTLAKNEFVHEKHIIESYDKIDEYISSGKNHFVVVMTIGFVYDEIVVRKLFDRNFKYFGVLGSQAKMKTLWRTLEKEGFDRTRLNKIHTPIGLPINSRTPEEIAVSIAAEIIAVKNSKG